MFVPVVLDMQQMYDMWLSLNAPNRPADEAILTQPVPEEKYIVMPTDYAEPMVGMHLPFSQVQKRLHRHQSKAYMCGVS